MYVLLGDKPSPVIDFDVLATDRDLFGATDATRDLNAVEPSEQ
jgi:hypothetical protein